jgi:hypothetical protein
MKCFYVARNPAAAWRRWEDEIIIVSPQDSSLYALNEVAAEIWEAADGNTPLHEIVAERVVSCYEVEFDEAYQDARELVDALAARELLAVSEKPLALSGQDEDGERRAQANRR